MNSDNQKTMLLLRQTVLAERQSKAYKVCEALVEEFDDYEDTDVLVALATTICNIFGCHYTQDDVRRIWEGKREGT